MPLAWVSCAGSRFRGTNREFVQSNECEGWVRCERDDPGAGPDLNRFYCSTRWDPQSRQYVRPT